MKVCTHCRSEIETTANKCPYCLEQPGDGFEVWNTIISVAMIGGLIWLVISFLF